MEKTLFQIALPPTKKFKVWLATTGGHTDNVIVALTFPRNKKTWDRNELEVPEGSLRIGLGTFLAWFCNDNPKMLYEMGLLRRIEDGGYLPVHTRVQKWVAAEIMLPCETFKEMKDGKWSDRHEIYGLDLYDQFG